MQHHTYIYDCIYIVCNRHISGTPMKVMLDLLNDNLHLRYIYSLDLTLLHVTVEPCFTAIHEYLRSVTL